jgi:hypothetical protein
MGMMSRTGLFLVIIGLFLFAGIGRSVQAETRTNPKDILMAHRAAKVDALRNLSERIYGLQLNSGTTVRNFVVASDTVQTRLAVQIQGAREVDSQVLEDGMIEVTVALTPGQVETILGRQIRYDSEVIEAVGYGVAAAIKAGQESGTAAVSMVRATGYGLAPAESGLSRAEKNLLGYRAAKNDALRNLSEKIDTVQVNAHTRVEEFRVTNDQIKTRVRTLLRNARVVTEKKLADGRYQVEVETDISTLRGLQ